MTINSAAHGSEVADALDGALDLLKPPRIGLDLMAPVRALIHKAAECQLLPAFIVSFFGFENFPAADQQALSDAKLPIGQQNFANFLIARQDGVKSLRTDVRRDWWENEAANLPRHLLYYSWRTALTLRNKNSITADLELTNLSPQEILSKMMLGELLGKLTFANIMNALPLCDPEKSPDPNLSPLLNLPPSNIVSFYLVKAKHPGANDMQVHLGNQCLGCRTNQKPGPIADLEIESRVAEGNHWQWPVRKGAVPPSMMTDALLDGIPKDELFVSLYQTYFELGLLF
jgi:hypothetical protein